MRHVLEVAGRCSDRPLVAVDLVFLVGSEEDELEENRPASELDAFPVIGKSGRQLHRRFC
jgi:hypothetical protein